MKRFRYAMTASLAAVLAASAGGYAHASTKLAGHVAKWVAKATKVGAASDGQTVRLEAMLGFRNQDQLTRLIAQQSTRGSPEYNHFLTAAQFHQRFSPSAQDEAKVEDSLRAMGFTVTGKSPSNLFIQFSGTVGQIKAAFGVSQNLYSFDGKVMRANAENPNLPASISGLVVAINGLDDTGLLIHPYHKSINEDATEAAANAQKGMNQAAAAAGVGGANAGPAVTVPYAANLPSPYCSSYFGDTVATLSTGPSPYATQIPWLICAYNPQQIRAAYGADKSTLNGAGVTVAVVDAYVSPTLTSDAKRYSTLHKLPAIKPGTNFQIIYGGDLAKVPNDDPCGPQGWFGEITLDVEAVHTMAPGANILFSGGLSCSNVDLDAALYTVIDGTQYVGGPLADVVSNSYGFIGEPLSPAQQQVDTAIFEQAAVEGVTVVFSSGDDGDNTLIQGIAEADWPASSPLVTAVGGTSLALTSSSGAKSEYGWGTFRAYLAGAMVNSATSVTNSGVGSYSFYSGAGGGPSFYWTQPGYQAGVVPLALADVTYDINDVAYSIVPPARVVPDVAMDADPYTGFLIGQTYMIAGNPVSDAGCTPISSNREYCESDIGGTSLASPLFAGTLAVVNQLRHANGFGNLGYTNGRLYALSVGAPGSTSTPLVDVQAPSSPTAVLRGYVNDLTRVRVVTINSVPGPFGPLCSGSFCNGQDSWILQTAPHYDNVTGVGVPYIPALLVGLGTTP
jgi:subtilase family serine protease